MIRAIIIGVGIAMIAIGVQCFCFAEMVIETDAVKTVPVAEFIPYSLISTGLVIYFYGYQLQKT
ncbi:MAG: hypothetical protein Q4G68_04725 [Planctomycetia bacterium]|nr:hypothetical protein [Planctomycetia bacterium]